MSRYQPVIKTYAYLLVFILLAGALVYIHTYAQTHIPAAYEVKRQDSNEPFLTFEDFKALGLVSSTATSEVVSRINQGIPDVKTVLTDDKYNDLFHLKLIAGSFFDGGAIKNASPYAVISDQLSLRLFLRVNAVGETIDVDGFTYVIIGVYQSDHSFWGSLAKDKYDRIFIPYTTYPSCESQVLSGIAFPCNVALPRTLDRLNITNHDKSYNFRRTNDEEALDCATQFIPIMLFIFKIVEIVLLLKIAYNAVKRYAQTIYAHRSDGYFLEIVGSHKKALLFSFFAISASVAGVVLLTKSLQFPIVLPSSSIPPDNLFDWAYYREELTKYFVSCNTCLVSGNNYYENLAAHTAFAGIALSCCIYPIVVLLYNGMKELVQQHPVHFLELIAYLCLSLGLMALLNTSINSVLLHNLIAFLLAVLLLFLVFFIHIKFRSPNQSISSGNTVQL